MYRKPTAGIEDPVKAVYPDVGGVAGKVEPDVYQHTKFAVPSCVNNKEVKLCP